MAERFVIADTHFTQASMLSFAGKDGVTPLRPWGRVCDLRGMTPEEKAAALPEFERRAAEMDEAMVERWNAIVPATGAKVYMLGDAAMNKRGLEVFSRLHGKKKLIYGNHDILKLKDYTPYFYDVGAYRIGDGVIMSHIPLHEESVNERWRANVHGHLHDGRVMMDHERWEHFEDDDGQKVSAFRGRRSIPNPRYLCVSVEHTDFAPLPWDEMMTRIDRQQGRS